MRGKRALKSGELGTVDEIKVLRSPSLVTGLHKPPLDGNGEEGRAPFYR